MFELHKNLNPSAQYSFQTSRYGRMLPMDLKTFYSSVAATDSVITVDTGIGPDSVRVWSTYEGWNIDCYGALIKDFVSLVDGKAKVPPEFINQALTGGLSVCQAVNRFFCDIDLLFSFSFSLHADGATGMLDVDVGRGGEVSRAVFPANIAKGEQFNLYYGESSKGGAVWAGDVKRSVNAYFQNNQPA